MTSFGLFAFCTTLKKLNTLMANLLLIVHMHGIYSYNCFTNRIIEEEHTLQAEFSYTDIKNL